MPATSMRSSTVTSCPAKKQIPNASDTIKVSLRKLRISPTGYEYGTQCYYGVGDSVYVYSYTIWDYFGPGKHYEKIDSLRAVTRQAAKKFIKSLLEKKHGDIVVTFYR